MARRKTRTLTEVELEVMRAVWDADEVTVVEVRGSLSRTGRPLALPSIRKMLAILREKGYVARRPLGRGFTYRAVVSEEQARKSVLTDIITRVFDGSASHLVAALVDTEMVSKRDLPKIRKLIEKHAAAERARKAHRQ